jgi:hypothetical protein
MTKKQRIYGWLLKKFVYGRVPDSTIGQLIEELQKYDPETQVLGLIFRRYPAKHAGELTGAD